ncbi:ATP-sensitive inward rectifier potassium channel 10 [Hassallia byssoidea VB512170]|uniref:ATP-sensitive inward rectifier potassium channel 10 n=1 Tax=Hassallia byssoidea VB512170 TaxID=1304833 RepID=A0A846H644_9CYAN|nr:ion channel [Hassalia byssoidea]NEU72438.1 ATP-sensitive inward rectifier potassium channel 10 [Hassalia byssoidea VB512170]
MKFRPQKPSRNQRQRRLPRVNIKIRDGRFQIMGMNTWYSYWREPYHLLLTIPWSGFLLLIAVTYLATNGIFALFYLAGGDCVENARPGSFLDMFFFSVQTLASIGYGAMYPKTTYCNIIVTIEAMAGPVAIAVMTGLAFARFSRPTARVMFSRVAIITPHEGMPTLIFRTANQRGNQILEAQMQVYLIRDEVTKEQEFIRRIYDLQLIRNHSPSFTLTWLGMHVIDESSPLYGISAESLIETNTTITVLLTGIDDTIAQSVHARHDYTGREILWNYRFVDVIYRTAEGHRYIDYNFFHDVSPLD